MLTYPPFFEEILYLKF